MYIEEIEIDGQLIRISPPVSDIQVAKATVIYQDSTGGAKASFSNQGLAEQFASLLWQI